MEEARLREDDVIKTLIPIASQMAQAGDDFGALRSGVSARAIAIGMEEENAWNLFRKFITLDTPEPDDSATAFEQVNQRDILGNEFPVLASPLAVETKTLVTRPAEPENKYGLRTLFSRVVQIEKLREVRAFYGFQRRKPSSSNPMVSPSLNRQSPLWLPSIEVLGEGIFVEFESSSLERWLTENKSQLADFTNAQLASAEDLGLPSRMGFQANPVFIMVHTFAHLLINQLSFDCGYASTSLRERVYCGTEQELFAGVLVYTADSDSEGSMGGLSEMGLPSRFAETVRRCVERSEWCSGDPVCRELEAQGINGLNRSACHACSLIAETSCTFNNLLLNRLLVSGSGRINGRKAREPKGYFRSLLEGAHAIS